MASKTTLPQLLYAVAISNAGSGHAETYRLAVRAESPQAATTAALERYALVKGSSYFDAVTVAWLNDETLIEEVDHDDE